MRKMLMYMLSVNILFPLQAHEKYQAKYLYKYFSESNSRELKGHEVDCPAELTFYDLVSNIGQMFKNIENEEAVKGHLSNIIANAIFMVSDAQERGICISKEKCKEIIGKLDEETRCELTKFVEYQKSSTRKIETGAVCDCGCKSQDCKCENCPSQNCPNKAKSQECKEVKPEEPSKSENCTQTECANCPECNKSEEEMKRHTTCDETGCSI